MAVLHDYKCNKHGYFESRKAECPMKDCQEEVFIVHLQAPSFKSDKTKFTDKTVEQLAMEFDMSDIKSTREGEHQSGYLTRKNKFKEKDYAEAEKYATRKPRKQREKVPVPEAPREPRPGDAAVWGGGGFQNLSMESILRGSIKPVRGESVGVIPSEAGIRQGPTIDGRSTLRDPDNLQIKR